MSHASTFILILENFIMGKFYTKSMSVTNVSYHYYDIIILKFYYKHMCLGDNIRIAMRSQLRTMYLQLIYCTFLDTGSSDILVDCNISGCSSSGGFVAVSTRFRFFPIIFFSFLILYSIGGASVQISFLDLLDGLPDGYI